MSGTVGTGIVYTQPAPPSARDIAAFLLALDATVKQAFAHRQGSLQELWDNEFGTIEFKIRLHAGRLSVVDISIGTTHKDGSTT